MTGRKTNYVWDYVRSMLGGTHNGRDHAKWSFQHACASKMPFNVCDVRAHDKFDDVLGWALCMIMLIVRMVVEKNAGWLNLAKTYVCSVGDWWWCICGVS